MLTYKYIYSLAQYILSDNKQYNEKYTFKSPFTVKMAKVNKSVITNTILHNIQTKDLWNARIQFTVERDTTILAIMDNGQLLFRQTITDHYIKLHFLIMSNTANSSNN